MTIKHHSKTPCRNIQLVESRRRRNRVATYLMSLTINLKVIKIYCSASSSSTLNITSLYELQTFSFSFFLIIFLCVASRGVALVSRETRPDKSRTCSCICVLFLVFLQLNRLFHPCRLQLVRWLMATTPQKCNESNSCSFY